MFVTTFRLRQRKSTLETAKLNDKLPGHHTGPGSFGRIKLTARGRIARADTCAVKVPLQGMPCAYLYLPKQHLESLVHSTNSCPPELLALCAGVAAWQCTSAM